MKFNVTFLIVFSFNGISRHCHYFKILHSMCFMINLSLKLLCQLEYMWYTPCYVALTVNLYFWSTYGQLILKDSLWTGLLWSATFPHNIQMALGLHRHWIHRGRKDLHGKFQKSSASTKRLHFYCLHKLECANRVRSLQRFSFNKNNFYNASKNDQQF